MRSWWLVFALSAVVLSSAPVEAKGRKKRKTVPAGWIALDDTLAYRAQPIAGPKALCDLHLLNLSSQTLDFFEFEFSYVHPRTHLYVTQRRPTYNKLAPGTYFYGDNWKAETADCKGIKVKVNSVRFAR